MKKLMLVCMMFVFGVSLAAVGPVQACSGGGIFPDSLPLGSTLDAEVFVAGYIYALGDSGINAVLQVDRVIKGDNVSEFILFARNKPVDIAEGRGLVGCDIYGPRLPIGQRFIAALRHSESGAYGGRIFGENEDRLFVLDNPDQMGEMLTFTYAEAIDFVAQRLKTTPYIPFISTKPRPAVVELRTTTRETYRLAVDQTTVIKLPPPSIYQCSPYDQLCLTSPNGIDTVWFEPIGSKPELGFMNNFYRAHVEGTAGVFSPQSDLITVWVGQRLDIYATAQQRGIAHTSEYGMSLLRSLDFDVDDSLRPGAGAWDYDGRIFAFSSKTGVWLWDALRPEAEPVLFLTNEVDKDPLVVRHFSPAGHYLALQAGVNWEPPSRRYNIDIATGQEYPDGLFSPDDRILAAYDTLAPHLTPLTLYSVLPVFEPLWQTNYGPLILDFEWIDRTTYLEAICGAPILNESERSSDFDEPWCKVAKNTLSLYDQPEWVDGFRFDYDPITNSLATVIDSDTISVNGEIIELEGQIDGKITGITMEPLIGLDYRNY